MKRFLILLFLIPIICYSQTEREDKLRIKRGGPSISNPTSEAQQKIVVRDKFYNQKQQTFETNTQIFNRNIYYNNNDWRWRMWGAPVSGFVGYTPSFYYDRFGLRQPSRIYRMADGQEKTVKGEKTHWRLGLSFNTDNQLGGWVSIGNKTFFVAEYCSFLTIDQSSFIPGLTMDEVLPWNDRKLDDITKGGAFYAGAGMKTGIVGFYLMPGYGWEINNFQYFDELFILSNNGKYSFPNYKENYFTGKVGLLFDVKNVSVKFDFNPFREHMGFGLGIVF